MTTHEDGLREALEELLLNADPDVSDTAIIVGNGASALLGKLRAALSASPKPAESDYTADDMEDVGSSLMETIECNRSHPLLQHWAPMDDPAEIVADLLNAYDEKDTPKQKEASYPKACDLHEAFSRNCSHCLDVNEFSPACLRCDGDGIVLEPRPAQSSDLAEALEVMREIRAKASGREPLPLPSGTKESHRNVALENLAILGGIERLSAAFVEKHRGGGK